MRIRALLLAPVLVLSSVAAVGCGAATEPEVSDVVGSSLRAVSRQQDDMKVHYSVRATLDATPSAGASAETRRFLSRPLAVTASGGASPEAFTLDGSVRFAGQSYNAKA